MRVVIVGGGVMGCATALSLATRGVPVTVLERSVPGAEASSAAAGILGAQAESHGPSPLLDMFVRARAEYAEWSAALREQSGIDVGYKRSGVLRIGCSASEAEALAREVAWQTAAGLRAILLDGPGARAVEPSLAPDVVGAAWFPDDAQVDPPLLLRALVAACARSGVAFRAGTTVHRLIVNGDRCEGVVLDDGELRSQATVLAAGSWSSLVPGVPAQVPAVRPARGQMVLLEERPPRAKIIVFGKGAYLVPRGDGRVLCGSTVEHVGFRREVTAGGVMGILQGAVAAMPALAEAQLTSTWSSFRPYTEGDPLVGASPLPGLFLATGHHRNGILLAKVSGEAVAKAIVASS